MTATSFSELRSNNPYWQERVDMACAFRWTERLGMHEGIANHFSLAVSDDGSQFLINPNRTHFRRITASSLVLIDANDPRTMERPDAPAPTAWGLHGALHRLCPHARCAMHVHSVYATVLACLDPPGLPPVDQNSALFFNRIAVDTEYGGLALEVEAERVCGKLTDPLKTVLIMGNHGVMVIGRTVAETFDRLYYFERAAETYVKALWTGRPLSRLSDEIAEKTATEVATTDDSATAHLEELKAILAEEGSGYAR